MGQDVNETGLLALPDGSIIAAMRSVTTAHLSTSISKDGGLTWDQNTKTVLADDAGNIDCGSPSSVKLPDGRIVTMYYQVDDPTNTPASAKSKVVIWKLPKAS